MKHRTYNPLVPWGVLLRLIVVTSLVLFSTRMFGEHHTHAFYSALFWLATLVIGTNLIAFVLLLVMSFVDEMKIARRKRRQAEAFAAALKTATGASRIQAERRDRPQP